MHSMMVSKRYPRLLRVVYMNIRVGMPEVALQRKTIEKMASFSAF